MTKLEQLTLRIYDEYQSILSNGIRPSTMDFFVNPDFVKWCPLKQTKSKNKHHLFSTLSPLRSSSNIHSSAKIDKKRS